jgi:sulfotransferase family protein
MPNPIDTETASELKILTAARLHPINDINPDDIFVAGYPKSGNTWMQHLLTGLLFGIDPRLSPDSLVQDLVPDIYFTKFYKRYLTPTFFKTHDLPKPQHRRVIYLIRDGRDAMVSYFHYLAALGALSDPLELVSTGAGLFPCRWHEHVEAWLANPYHADMITVSYERLKGDLMTELRRICDFAGLERGQTILTFVAQNCTFATMRENEIKYGRADPAWPRDKPFVRRGEVGSYKDEMEPEILEAFLQLSAPVLERMGYL